MKESSLSNVSVACLVCVTYLANILTGSFAVMLINMNQPAWAAPLPPVSLVYTCDEANGYRLNAANSCVKKEVTEKTFTCADSRKTVVEIDGKLVCRKRELRPTQNVCLQDGTNWLDDQEYWDFRDPIYPEFCSSRRSISSGSYNIAYCPNGYKDDFDSSSGTCWKLSTPLDTTCPDFGGQPEEVQLTCPEQYAALGQCDPDDTETVTGPDQAWHKITNPDSEEQAPEVCERFLYEGVIESCPNGYSAEDEVCVRRSSATPVASCPSGYYADGGYQCLPGTAPSCPTGSLVNGVCINDGEVSGCPTGQSLDPHTGLCFNTYDFANDGREQLETSDINYFSKMGADMGKLSVSSQRLPTQAAGGGYSMEVKPLNPTISAQTITMSNEEAMGIDAQNQSYDVSASGTYMNESEQRDSIRASIERNQETVDLPREAYEGSNEQAAIQDTDHSGLAYLTIMSIQNDNPPQNIGPDSGWIQQGFQEVDAVRNGDGGRYFSDCTSQTIEYDEVLDGTLTVQQQQCFKPNRSNMSGCIIEREVIPPELKIIEGADDARVTVCGEKCLRLTIGLAGQDNLSDGGQPCKIYEERVTFSIAGDSNIESAVITHTEVDDHYELYIDDTRVVRDVGEPWNSLGTFPTETESCEWGRNGYDTTPRDVTDVMREAFADDRRVSFAYKLAIGGRGNAYAKIDVHFDQPISTEWSENIVESPEGCQVAIETPADTFCTASGYECLVEWSPSSMGLHSWATFGAGQWEVQDESSVVQKKNDHPTVYVTQKTYGFNVFEGTLKTTDDDDDFMGFVLGYPEMDANSPDNSFYIFSWRGGAQESQRPGFVLAETYGGVVAPTYSSGEFGFPQFGDHQDGSQVGSWPNGVHNSYPERGWFVLDSNVSLSGEPSKGWRRNQEYQYRIEFSSTEIRILIDEEEVLKANGDFHPGRFGFFNYSQKEVHYGEVTQMYPDGYEGGDIYNPLFPGDSEFPICMVAKMKDYICDPLKGNRLPLGNGGTIGYTDILNMEDGCHQYSANSRCHFEKSECAEGWYNEANNQCYGWDVTYNCESGSQVVVRKTRENNTCFTDTPCIGGDCTIRADETNTDFAQTAAMYAAIDEIKNDPVCTDPNDPSTCQVFKGTPEYCAWDQLKVNDCCSTEGLDATSMYFKAGMLTFQAGEYAVMTENPFTNQFMQDNYARKGWDMVQGGWDKIAEPVSDAASSFWSTVTEPISSVANGVSGNAAGEVMSSAGEAVSDFVTDASAALADAQTAIYDYIYNLLPDTLQTAVQEAATSLASSAAGETAEKVGGEAVQYLGEYIAGAIGFVMWMYTIYKLLELLYTILTACEDEELEMPTNLKAKKCFIVRHVPCSKTFGICTNRALNQYCCFNSALSRIIMEQSIEQLGYTKAYWRDTEQCRGLYLDELEGVDFSLFDWSEWIGLMTDSGMFPEDTSMDALTGDDNFVNSEGRNVVDERTLERFGDSVASERRQDFKDASIETNIDCNTVPRPTICDVGITLPTQP